MGGSPGAGSLLAGGIRGNRLAVGRGSPEAAAVALRRRAVVGLSPWAGGFGFAGRKRSDSSTGSGSRRSEQDNKGCSKYHNPRSLAKNTTPFLAMSLQFN